MKNLLKLQELDLKLEKLRSRETEIPKQKNKFDIHKKRLNDELQSSEQRLKKLQLEQRDCEGEIAAKQDEIKRKDGQLLAVKKNEEYQALLHEMEMLKKQISAREERVIAILMELDDAKSVLEEDRKRISAELAEIDAECARIDEELAVAIAERKAFEAQRAPLIAVMNPGILSKYERIRKSKKTGPDRPLAGRIMLRLFHDHHRAKRERNPHAATNSSPATTAGASCITRRSSRRPPPGPGRRALKWYSSSARRLVSATARKEDRRARRPLDQV